MPFLTPLKDLFRRKILRPLLLQLRDGANPRRVAWSLALGLVIGIIPVFGITTALVILLTTIFRLNHISSQVGVHSASPLQIVLFVPFVSLGVRVFHSAPLPLDRAELARLSHHPLTLVRTIWLWEWHALIAWAIAAAVLMPLLARYIRRALILLMRRHRHLMHAHYAPGKAA